jgi:hypothetical protein
MDQPMGVTGPMNRSPMKRRVHRAGPARVGSPAAVIGRACSKNRRPAGSMAHSTSWGQPVRRSTARPRRPSLRRSLGVSRGSSGRGTAAQTRSSEEPGTSCRGCSTGLTARSSTCRRAARRPKSGRRRGRPNVARSGVTWPETSASPMPNTASNVISAKLPVTGFIVNKHPGDPGVDERHDHHAHAQAPGGPALGAPVHMHPVGEEAGPAAAHRRLQGVALSHVE